MAKDYEDYLDDDDQFDEECDERTAVAKVRAPAVVTAPDPLATIQAALRRINLWLGALTLSVLVLGVAGGVLLVHRPFKPSLWTSLGETQPLKGWTSVENGPWGDLVYMPVKVCPPLELLRAAVPVNYNEVVWYWPNLNEAKLREELAPLKLSDATRSKLLAMAQSCDEVSGLAMRPSRDFIVKLSAQQRTELYTALSKYSQNGDQGLAFRFRGQTLEDWLNGATLSSPVRKLLDALVYRHGDYLFFADLRCLEQSFASPDERTLLLRTMSRESTYALRLRVTPQSDIEALVRYWGRGGREKDVRPLIEATANTEGGLDIPVGYLLPPFARDRLYTFPVPAEQGIAMHQDCHWSSLNFFSSQPDDKYCKAAEVFNALTQDYYRVYANPQLGDIVEFLDETGSGRHAAVFIADQFVFTKNGVSSSRPWMLVKLDDLKDYYPNRKPFEIRYYRRKDL